MDCTVKSFTKKGRESNFELLRLVCMFSIVFYHILLHKINGLSGDYWVYKSLTIIMHFGVVVFILISGWFGIKLSIKRILSIYLPLLLYTLLIHFVSLHFQLYEESVKSVLLLKDNNSLWFIQPYLLLCIVSPIVNRSIKKIPKKELRFFLFLTGLVVFVMGFIGNYEVARGGKTLFCFVFLYILGAYLRMESNQISQIRNIHCKLLSAVSLVAVLILIGKGSGIFILEKIAGSFYSYNSPGLILFSSLILLLFSQFSFQSKKINYLAASSFSIFLIASNDTVLFYINEMAAYLFNNTSYTIVFIFELIAFSALICTTCLLIDIPIRSFVTRPLINIIDRLLIRTFHTFCK